MVILGGSITAGKHRYQKLLIQSKQKESKDNFLPQDEHTVKLCEIGKKTSNFCLSILESYFLNKVSNQLIRMLPLHKSLMIPGK